MDTIQQMQAQAPPPSGQPALLEVPLTVPPGAYQIVDILTPDIFGYIQAQPQSPQVRGFILKHTHLGLTPELHAKLGTAEEIFKWVRISHYQKHIAPFGTPATVGIISRPARAQQPAGDTVAIDAEIVQRVSGTYVRDDILSGSIRVPRTVANQGAHAVETWIVEHYADADLERSFGEDDMSEQDSEFEAWGDDHTSIADQLEELGIDPG